MFNLLHVYISTFRGMCAVPNMAVFCSSLISCFPVMFVRYFLNDFEMVPVSPIITGVTFVFTFHMRCISVVRSLYFRIFSAFFLYPNSVSRNFNIYLRACFFFIITDYDVWFIVLDGYCYYLLSPLFKAFTIINVRVTNHVCR